MDESIRNERKINVAKLEVEEPKFEIKKAATFEILNGKQIEIEDTVLETMDPRETKLRNTIGYLFASSPDIVENILSCMTYYELCKIRTVCTFWNITAEKIIGKRKVFQYACHFPVSADVGHDGPVTTDTVLQSIKEQFSTRPNICLVFQSEIRRGFENNFSSSIRNYLPPNCNTIIAMCLGIIGTHERYNRYQSRIGKVMFQPSKKCRSLEKDDDWKSFDHFKKKFDESFPCLKEKYPDTHFFVTTYMKFKCATVLKHTLKLDYIKCCDSHGKPKSSLFYYETHDENLQTACDLVKHYKKYRLHKKTGFYIPLPGKSYCISTYDSQPSFQFTMLTMPDNIPGVEIIPISIKEGNSESDYTEEQLKDVKAVLVLCINRNETNYNAIHYLNEVMRRNKKEVAISGVFLNCLTATIPSSGDDNPMDKDDLCIAFKGKSLKAATILIRSELTKEEEIVAELNKFKDKEFYDPTKQSFAFMFVCVARFSGEHEVKLFREIYPDTPVFGAYGDGEFGWEYFPGVTKIDDTDETIDCWENIHSHCTSILFIQIDN